MFRKLYAAVTERGGMINVHAYGFVNFTAIPYIHQNWYGENLQFVLNKGSSEDMNLDYFRAEYLGRNIGAPVEFIAYANPPHWNFEQALAMSISARHSAAAKRPRTSARADEPGLVDT